MRTSSASSNIPSSITNTKFSIKYLIPVVAAALLYFLCFPHSTSTINPPSSTLHSSSMSIEIADFKGKKNVVIFFYPKSFTYGCTRENIAFAQNYNQFADLNTEVIGVSNDEVGTQDKFSCEHNLPFVLLSDKGSKGAKAFGVSGDFFGMIPGRTTFVINKEGNIVLKHNSALKWNSHIEESLAAVKKLEGK